jgi:hypothetical protein
LLAKGARQIGYSPHWLVVPADARRGQALTALRILGQRAQSAKPSLERLATSSDPKVRDALGTVDKWLRNRAWPKVLNGRQA